MDQVKDFFNRMSGFSFSSWARSPDGPLAPFRDHHLNMPQNLLSPVIFALASLWTIVTTGVAIGSFVALFGSLMMLYFIMTRIFGLTLDENTVIVA